MWNHLPFDLLAKIFSFLPPDSFARATSSCRHWHTCAKTHTFSSNPSSSSSSSSPGHHRNWFVALPTRNRGLHQQCYLHNPIVGTWHQLSLDFLPDPVRPVAPVGCLILLRPTNSTVLQLAVCNPFTRQFRYLPMLNVARTNPAVGVVVLDPAKQTPFPYFRVYVAGGMSDAPRGGATYEPSLEMYDSRYDTWEIMGPMPVEFAVRLTVWTPNESVYSKDGGVLYWMTSARAYSLMGFNIGSNTWRELSVPMADRLEFAALAWRNGRLTLVGGTCGGDACVWELREGDVWGLIEKVPKELGMRFLGGKRSWSNTKCVGGDGEIFLYREIGSGMVVWRESGEMGKWEWVWVGGCSLIRGKQVQNLAIKGVVLYPNLARSCIPRN